jgi:Uma2 family endonuclease
MSSLAHPRRHFTLDEYFAIERVGDARYEYWDGDIICMSGGTPQHGRLTSSIFRLLSAHLGDGPCDAFTSDQAVSVPKLPPYRYPDASVVCAEPVYETFGGISALLNPILLVEVLSAESEIRDRETKRVAYQAIPTLRDYLIIAQDAPHAALWTRQTDDDWRAVLAEGLDSLIFIPSVRFNLSLAELYRRVQFSNSQLRKV